MLRLVFMDESVGTSLVQASSVVAETVLGFVDWDEAVGISLVIRTSTVVVESVLEFVGGDEAVGISLVIKTSLVVAIF